MKEMRENQGKFISEQWGASDLLPTSWKQEVSEYRFFELLERVLGRALSEADKQWFEGCICVEQFMARLVESKVFEYLSLRGNPITLGRLGEFYVCLRCDMRWEPRTGFDIWGALEFRDEIGVGKVEVKTGGPGSEHNWQPQITGRKQVLLADVIIFIGMAYSFNPCEGAMIVIPADRLQEEVDKQLKRAPHRIPSISISRNRYNRRTGSLNGWYEFELHNHAMLRKVIAEHIHGEFNIISQQLPLFNYLVPGS